MPTLTLSDNRPDGHKLHRLDFRESLADHAEPGQFVTAHLEGHKPAFFALASAPGQPVTLLVKRDGDVAEELCGLKAGDTVEVSAPMGGGFGLVQPGERPLRILVTGSGISAVRPVIQREVDAGLPRPVSLLYGVFTPDHVSFRDDLEAWKAAGVEVQVACSEPPPGWEGPTGFVQDAASRLGWVTDDVDVVLCGYPAMAQAARTLFEHGGLPADRIHLNY